MTSQQTKELLIKTQAKIKGEIRQAKTFEVTQKFWDEIDDRFKWLTGISYSSPYAQWESPHLIVSGGELSGSVMPASMDFLLRRIEEQLSILESQVDSTEA